MDNDKFLKIFNDDIKDEMLEVCGDYIEKNSAIFVQSASEVFTQSGRVLTYDFAEIKDIEEPEILSVTGDNQVFNVSVSIPYILDLWEKEKDKFIGAVFGTSISTLIVNPKKANGSQVSIKHIKDDDSYFDEYLD